MSIEALQQVALEADLIVTGYAFTLAAQGVRVLNLAHPDSAALLARTGDVLETTMDDVELTVVGALYGRNRKHLELSNA